MQPIRPFPKGNASADHLVAGRSNMMTGGITPAETVVTTLKLANNNIFMQSVLFMRRSYRFDRKKQCQALINGRPQASLLLYNGFLIPAGKCYRLAT
jgi:hypothetical protein